MDAGPAIAARFTWHPKYAGRLLLDVRQELVQEIANDQRAMALTLDAAEEREDDVLASVLRMEKKWSPYDLDWVEADPGELADRILAWEWERERRHELFPYAEMRDRLGAPAAQPKPTSGILDWLRGLFDRSE